MVDRDSFTLAVDLGGPFQFGKDQEGEGRAYTIPVTKEGKALMNLAPEQLENLEVVGGILEEVRRLRRWVRKDKGLRTSRAGGPAWDKVRWRMTLEGLDRKRDVITVLYYQGVEGEDAALPGEEPLPEEEEGDGLDPGDGVEVADDGEEWLKKVEAEEDFEVRQLTLVEIVKSWASANLMEAVARMVTKLRYYGLPVKRLHSDRAREFTAKRARRWALDSGILRTFTGGSSWKMNGRAEAEVGFMKRLTNTLIKGTGIEEKLWPLAAWRKKVEDTAAGHGLSGASFETFWQQGNGKCQGLEQQDEGLAGLSRASDHPRPRHLDEIYFP